MPKMELGSSCSPPGNEESTPLHNVTIFTFGVHFLDYKFSKWMLQVSHSCKFFGGEKNTSQVTEYLKSSVFEALKLKLFASVSIRGLDDFILLYVTLMPHCWKNVATCDPEPPLAVVWAVSTHMPLEYIHIWPSRHQTVTPGLSRDSMSELVLYSTQSSEWGYQAHSWFQSQNENIICTHDLWGEPQVIS